MEHVAIAALRPELPGIEYKQFRAVATLIWPYSSSQRQFALLLGEPDFRLRRKAGQVRARFAGSSARAIASTGVGIGDEVVLSLRGATFVQDGSVSTPGKSIDWELSYTQTLSARIIRNGTEFASLDLNNVAPTPAPRSPVRHQPPLILEQIQEWASPAFVKRARLSDGPIFDAGYDPFNDGIEDRHDSKRRRRSYRDWNAWTYSARTPSPEKEDAGMEDFTPFGASPIRATKTPVTPVSPPKPEITSKTSLPLPQIDGAAPDLDSQHVAEVVAQDSDVHPHTRSSPLVEDFVRDADYYDLYAGPDEVPPQELHVSSEEDTVPNTEDEEGFSVIHTAAHANFADTDADDTSEEETEKDQSLDVIEVLSLSDASEAVEEGSLHGEQHSAVEVADVTSADVEASEEYERSMRERSGTVDGAVVLDDVPDIVMPPPPALPLLQTDFQASFTPGLLTPIGREPSSPNLQPLDSATLPIPSPFPGERDGNTMSFLEHVGSSQPEILFEEPQQHSDTNDEDFIIESSFYSSVNASNAPGVHATHESAFTDVRFTFGMDGSTFSRPAVQSKPANEQDSSQLLEAHFDIEEVNSELEEEPGLGEIGSHISEDMPETTASSPQPESHETQQLAEVIELSSDSHPGIEYHSENEYGAQVNDELPAELLEVEPASGSSALEPPETDRLSIREASSRESSAEDLVEIAHSGHPAAEGTTSDVQAADELLPISTERSLATTEIVDLGSGSEDEGDNQEDAETDEPSAIVHGAFEGGTEAESLIYSDFKVEEPPSSSGKTEAHNDEPNFADQHTQEDEQIARSAEAVSVHSIQPQPGGEVEHDDGAHMLIDDEPHLAEDLPNDRAPGPSAEQNEVLSGEDVTNDSHPDIKMESIEEEDGPDWTQTQGSLPDDDAEYMAGSSAELLIAVPEEGHKIGDMQLVSVPATGPARNTRSKTKTSMSPTKAESPGIRRSARSKESKGPKTSGGRTTVSPIATRSMSTASPNKDTTVPPSYRLGPQIKRLSRTESTTPVAEPRRRKPDPTSPTKDTSTEQAALQADDIEWPDINFGPSQELGLSQGSRFSNVTYVKDSEEGSLHSENSVSTVQYSGDWNMGTQQLYTNESDPLGPDAEMQDLDSSPLKPRPADRAPSLTTPTRISSQTRGKPELTDMPAKSTPPQPDFSFVTQPAQSSPSHSVTPLQAATRSPRRSQRLRVDENHKDNNLEKDASAASNDEVAYPTITIESDNDMLRSSPPPSPQADRPAVNTEQVPSSPPVAQVEFASVNKQSRPESNMPITPEATQRTNSTSQPSFAVAQQEQSMPITPELTQSTSAGLRSFQVETEVEHADADEPVVKPSPIAKSTPRRNVTDTDVASDQASPTTRSAEMSDSEEDVPDTELPSVGLSTPIAYYTPVKELPFFLNRSSQFHSSSFPDVLALVTSASTTPKRATSGPKHHLTTFHITDLSSYPSSTTVQVFRPYVTALPVAEKGDVVLLRAFGVKSLNRRPMLVSGEESAWCVWRFSKLLWGRKRGPFGEIKEREEVKGPVVERGEGEWKEVEKIRAWYLSSVKKELEEKEAGERKTRSKDKVGEKVDGDAEV